MAKQIKIFIWGCFSVKALREEIYEKQILLNGLEKAGKDFEMDYDKIPKGIFENCNISFDMLQKKISKDFDVEVLRDNIINIINNDKEGCVLEDVSIMAVDNSYIVFSDSCFESIIKTKRIIKELEEVIY